MSSAVALCSTEYRRSLADLIARFGLQVRAVQPDHDIPGSYWGDSEAGLIGDSLHVRGDTPVHSALHEACHYICMDEHRRQTLHTDAGGDVCEENAVCYLQSLLAACMSNYGRQRLWTDMDLWGYSFRLGSAQAWFENDAEDARDWLLAQQLIDPAQRPTWRVRT